MRKVMKLGDRVVCKETGRIMDIVNMKGAAIACKVIWVPARYYAETRGLPGETILCRFEDVDKTTEADSRWTT